MIEVTPLGPGFFIFFQTENYYGPYTERGLAVRKKQKDDEEVIMLVIKSFLEKEG